MNIQVRGAPKTKVGLLAVDEGVYLMSDYHRLTEEKVLFFGNIMVAPPPI